MEVGRILLGQTSYMICIMFKYRINSFGDQDCRNYQSKQHDFLASGTAPNKYLVRQHDPNLQYRSRFDILPLLVR